LHRQLDNATARYRKMSLEPAAGGIIYIRAVEKHGKTVDFLLRPDRGMVAALFRSPVYSDQLFPLSGTAAMPLVSTSNKDGKRPIRPARIA